MAVPLHSVEKLELYEKSFSGEKKGKINELIDLREQIDKHDASVIQECIGVINTSNHIVDENYGELISSMDEYERYDGEIEDQEMNLLAVEIVRHFSNFVSSAKSRENHTRDYIIPRLKEIDQSTTIENDYSDAISRFGVDVYGEFFSDLRNIFVHERILTPSGQERGHYDGETMTIERELVYKKDKLMESDEWSERGKAIIEPDKDDEDVSIQEESQFYYEAMERLYDWFEDYILDEFGDEIEDRGQLIKKAKQLQDDIFT